MRWSDRWGKQKLLRPRNLEFTQHCSGSPAMIYLPDWVCSVLCSPEKKKKGRTMGGSVKHILEWKCFCGPLNPIPPLCIQLWRVCSRSQPTRGQYYKNLTNGRGVWSGLPEFKEGYPYDRGTMARAGLHYQHTNSASSYEKSGASWTSVQSCC